MSVLSKSSLLKEKASTPSTFSAAFWAGASIALGASLFALISSLNGDVTLYKWIGAGAFSVGLILIVFLKGQLFTGNNLMIYSILKREMTFMSLLRNWGFVYLGNFIGSIAFVCAIWFFHLNYVLDEGLVMRLAAIAKAKISASSGVLFFKAIACNILVCLAVYHSIAAKKWWLKIIAVIIPITLFVGLGFEHSIANMFLIPIGLVIGGGLNSFTAIGLFYNLLWVTLGNIIGGAVVSLVIFIRSHKEGIV